MDKTPSNFRYIKAASPEQAADFISSKIAAHSGLGKKVLWFLSGGSAIEVAVLTAKTMEGSDLGKLVVTLIDERYGEIGHADSNWEQLMRAGLKLPKAMLYPVLQGKSIEKTADDYENWLTGEFKTADYKIALLGMGPDGHTSGILPGSPALRAKGLSCFYQGPDYIRITTTPEAIQKLDEAVLYAVGESKWPQLQKLNQDIPIDEQPAQILKQIPKVTIFNDLKGDSL